MRHYSSRQRRTVKFVRGAGVSRIEHNRAWSPEINADLPALFAWPCLRGLFA